MGGGGKRALQMAKSRNTRFQGSAVPVVTRNLPENRSLSEGPPHPRRKCLSTGWRVGIAGGHVECWR